MVTQLVKIKSQNCFFFKSCDGFVWKRPGTTKKILGREREGTRKREEPKIHRERGHIQRDDTHIEREEESLEGEQERA